MNLYLNLKHNYVDRSGVWVRLTRATTGKQRSLVKISLNMGKEQLCREYTIEP